MGKDEIRKPLFGALGALVAVVVVLMMGLDLGHRHEERLLSLILIQVLQREVIDAVRPVALKIDLIVIFIEHVAVIAVGRELQNVRRPPEDVYKRQL